MPLRTLVNQNGDPVPVLRLGCASGKSYVVDGGTATNTATTGFGGNVIRMSADVGVCFRFHNSATETLAATQDHRIPANSVEAFDISDMGNVFMSFRGATGGSGQTGTLWISVAV